jgi:hypothetical protein
MLSSMSPALGADDAPTICFHTELDRYTGSHPATGAGLLAVVRELTEALLLHDYVIVAPATLTANPLGLPAFEALASAVRAGLLGTSLAEGDRPRGLIHRRLAESAALAELASGGVLGRRERDMASWLEARWAEILPDRWPVRRDVVGQVRSYKALFERRFDQLAERSRLAARVALVGEAAREHRDRLAATALQIVSAAESAELRELLALAQLTTLELGARFSVVAHATGLAQASIFPGRWVLAAATANASLGLPLAPRLSPRLMARFGRLGIPIAGLASHPGHQLTRLLSSGGWRSLRAAVLAAPDDDLAEAALRHAPEVREAAREVLRGASGALGAPVGPAQLRPGSRRVLARLGSAAPAPERLEAGAQPVLDLRRRELRDGDRTVRLGEPELAWLVVLALVADAGLPRAERLALDHELRRGNTGPMGPSALGSVAARRRSARCAETRQRVMLHRLRAHLSGTRVRIVSVGGAWSLRLADGGPLSVLETAWSGERPDRGAAPELPLRPLLRRVWGALWALGPVVDLHALALHLRERAALLRSADRLARDVSAVGAALAASASPWALTARRGRYEIVSRPRSAPSDLEEL